MPDDPIRILIADDNAQVRYGLRVLIELYEDFHLLGEAQNGHEAVDLCQQLQPDLVLMDLVMPQMDGVTATRAIRQCCPQIKIIVLTSAIEYNLIDEAMSAGAHAYFLKNLNIDALADAIRSAVL